MNDAIEELSEVGYLVATGIDHLRSLLSCLGSNRDGGTLVPVAQDLARADSLSGIYGMGRFPWHTDGAVSDRAPRWVAMYSARASSVPTEILELSESLRARLSRTDLRIRTRDGRTVIRRAAVRTSDGSHRVRWDPRAAPPLNPRVVDIVENELPTALVPWRADSFVILDNRRLLHRRPPAASDPGRKLVRYYVD